MSTSTEQFELPEGVYRCPACGRFVDDENGWGDVEPGGVRGVDYLAAYCGPQCSGKVKCAHGHALTATCPDGCE